MPQNLGHTTEWKLCSYRHTCCKRKGTSDTLSVGAGIERWRTHGEYAISKSSPFPQNVTRALCGRQDAFLHEHAGPWPSQNKRIVIAMRPLRRDWSQGSHLRDRPSGTSSSGSIIVRHINISGTDVVLVSIAAAKLWGPHSFAAAQCGLSACRIPGAKTMCSAEKEGRQSS